MARKKRRKSSRQKNINWGQGMASFGDINATLGLVFAWLMMFGCISFGIFLIVRLSNRSALHRNAVQQTNKDLSPPTSSEIC